MDNQSEVKSSRINDGKCCRCIHYGKPCKLKKIYVARKKDACGDFKYKE